MLSHTSVGIVKHVSISNAKTVIDRFGSVSW